LKTGEVAPFDKFVQRLKVDQMIPSIVASDLLKKSDQTQVRKGQDRVVVFGDS
jgi:hypothetical protein